MDVGDSGESRFLRYREELLPYWDSDLVNAARESRRFSNVDLDGTMTRSDGDPSQKELAEREEAVRLLQENDGAVGHNTFRTIELIIDSAMYAASQQEGLDRSEPHVLQVDGRQVYKAIEEVPKFAFCYGAHAGCTAGTGIHLRHGGVRYIEDIAYTRVQGNWRKDGLDFLYRVDDPGEASFIWKALASIENVQNYLAGDTNVSPPQWRIQLEWTEEQWGKRAAEYKNRAKRRLLLLQDQFRPHLPMGHPAKRFDLVDESNIAAKRYVLYLVPLQSTKEHMMNHVLRSMADASGVNLYDFSVFVAGDTMTDLRAGMQGGNGAQVTFLLAGGSRLAPYLSPNGKKAGKSYAGEEMRDFTQMLADGKTDRKGVYQFKGPTDRKPRTVIIGDEAFRGEHGPASIAATLAYLKKSCR